MAKLIPCAEIGCASVELQKVCTFPADPDIAGIGTVLSFFISVSLSFLLAVYGFYFIQGSYITNQLTKLDVLIAGPANATIRRSSSSIKPLITREVFREVILVFSDQQLITGLAILTVAFWKFKSITEYHFAVVSDLSNISLVVQFSASNILGEVVSERPEMVWWRVTAFVVLAVLAMITNVPWGNQYYLHTYGSEMACLWNKSSGNYSAGLTAQMTVYMLLSLWGIIDVIGKYFPRVLDNRVFRGIRDTMVAGMLYPRRHYLKRQHASNSSKVSGLIRSTFLALAFLIFTISEIIYSEAVELIRNWSLLLVNVIDVFGLRSLASSNGRLGNEDAWGFGQAVPMLMLILPLCTLFELYWDGYFRRKLEESDSLEAEQDGIQLPAVSSQGDSTGTEMANRLRPPPSRERLSARLLRSSRTPSPAPNHTQTLGPGLSLADDTNSGNYYFSYPAAKMGSTEFEDRLYDNLYFQVWLWCLMIGVFLALTMAACFGLTI